MADVINRTTLQHLSSVNTPDFPDPPWKARPDMSQVQGVPRKYWKWHDGQDRPVEMNAAEKVAADAAIQDALEASAVAPLDSAGTPDLLRALALVVMDEINLLRAQHALAPRTVAQLKTALRNKMS